MSEAVITISLLGLQPVLYFAAANESLMQPARNGKTDDRRQTAIGRSGPTV
jgi:hypothetical protein